MSKKSGESSVERTGKLAMKYGVTGHVYAPYVSPVSLRSGSP